MTLESVPTVANASIALVPLLRLPCVRPLFVFVVVVVMVVLVLLLVVLLCCCCSFSGGGCCSFSFSLFMLFACLRLCTLVCLISVFSVFLFPSLLSLSLSLFLFLFFSPLLVLKPFTLCLFWSACAPFAAALFRRQRCSRSRPPSPN